MSHTGARSSLMSHTGTGSSLMSHIGALSSLMSHTGAGSSLMSHMMAGSNIICHIRGRIQSYVIYGAGSRVLYHIWGAGSTALCHLLLEQDQPSYVTYWSRIYHLVSHTGAVTNLLWNSRDTLSIRIYPEWPHRQGCKVARLQDRISAVAELHRFILCTGRSGGTSSEGGGCDQSIGSTVSDAIVLSRLWSTSTRSSPAGCFSILLQVVDN